MKTLPALTLLALVAGPAGLACRGPAPGPETAHGDPAAHEGHEHHEESTEPEPLGNAGDGGQGEHAGHGHEAPPRAEDGIVELQAEAAEAARIRTELVRTASWLGGIQTTGEVHFDGTRLAHVSPRLQGRIHRVSVAPGERVAKGQAIAVIDSVELGKAKAESLAARARLDLAQRTLDREEGLLERRISSEQQVLEARANREEASAMFRSATDTLRVLGLSQAEIEGLRHGDPAAPLFTVRAPFPGKLVELHATLGELVGPETQLATVADLSRLWVWVDVYERDIGRVHEGDRAEVRLDAFPGEPIAGRLAYLRDEVDRNTRTVRARIDVENADERIKPGMFARVLLEQQDRPGNGPGVIVVPSGAVQRDGEQHLAFVRAGAARYQVRVLRIGRRSGALVEVLEGLSPGEELVVEGGFLLKSELGKSAMGHGHSH